MKQGITLESHCVCSKCKGTGILESLRCQAVHQNNYYKKSIQCSNVGLYEIDGVAYCGVHYLPKIRKYKKGEL